MQELALKTGFTVVGSKYFIKFLLYFRNCMKKTFIGLTLAHQDGKEGLECSQLWFQSAGTQLVQFFMCTFLTNKIACPF